MSYRMNRSKLGEEEGLGGEAVEEECSRQRKWHKQAPRGETEPVSPQARLGNRMRRGNSMR